MQIVFLRISSSSIHLVLLHLFSFSHASPPRFSASQLAFSAGVTGWWTMWAGLRKTLYSNFHHNSPPLHDNSFWGNSKCHLVFHTSPHSRSLCNTGHLETPRKLAEVITASSVDTFSKCFHNYTCSHKMLRESGVLTEERFSSLS